MDALDIKRGGGGARVGLAMFASGNPALPALLTWIDRPPLRAIPGDPASYWFGLSESGTADPDDRDRWQWLGLAAIQEVMDLSPRNIREHLNLSRPIYAPTSAYGHFGREPTADGGFSWERTDLVDDLKAALS